MISGVNISTTMLKCQSLSGLALHSLNRVYRNVQRWSVFLVLLLAVTPLLNSGNASQNFALLNGFLCPSAKADMPPVGFEPQQYKNGIHYGEGIYFAPYHFTLYAQPKDNAPVVAEFEWNKDTSINTIKEMGDNAKNASEGADNVFFCFYPRLNIAMMAMLDDNDQGWAEVIYDQKNQKSGWVKLKTTPPKNDAQVSATANDPPYFGVDETWQEFMRLNTRHGIYWLSGVQEAQRAVHSSDADDGKIVPVTIIRDLKVKFVRGNWLLVEILDFERATPIGWIRWRDDDGNLLVFPNVTDSHMSIITTTY